MGAEEATRAREIRGRVKFLWWPKTLTDPKTALPETRWLEKGYWRERYQVRFIHEPQSLPRYERKWVPYEWCVC